MERCGNKGEFSNHDRPEGDEAGGTMSYDYIKRAYSVSPEVGARVRHTETNRNGVITREDRSQSHYVMVRFDGDKRSLPCHPTALDYSPPDYSITDPSTMPLEDRE
jgi:hypothetical protein